MIKNEVEEMEEIQSRWKNGTDKGCKKFQAEMLVRRQRRWGRRRKRMEEQSGSGHLGSPLAFLPAGAKPEDRTLEVSEPKCHCQL